MWLGLGLGLRVRARVRVRARARVGGGAPLVACPRLMVTCDVPAARRLASLFSSPAVGAEERVVVRRRAGGRRRAHP